MPFLGFGLDPTMLLVLPALAFALWAQFKVRSTYEKYSQIRSRSGRTGRDMALSIMARNGVTGVNVEEVGGMLSDHYDPRSRVVSLSAPIYEGASISSIAVAAHEVGHVLQHQQGYFPLAFRSTFAPAAGIGSWAAFPLFIVGMFLSRSVGPILMDAAIVLFAAAVVFHLVTLPVEFDASRRALVQLTDSGAIPHDEVVGAKAVLDAAALTYVAAAATAALQLMRLLILRNSRD